VIEPTADSTRIPVVLHGLIKKTAKTPQGDLDLARRRMKEIKR
jgi:phage-related protein